jgi:hypothetical protein
MGDVTITIPAEHSHAFRMRMVRGFAVVARDVSKMAQRYADRQEDDDLQALHDARSHLHDFEALMERVGWMTPTDDPGEAISVSADAQLFEPVLREWLRDIGRRFAERTEDAATIGPSNRAHRLHLANCSLEQYGFVSRAFKSAGEATDRRTVA